MGVIAQGLTFVANFFHGQYAVPPDLAAPLIVIAIYGIHLLISALVLFYALKTAGVSVDFMTTYPRALLTVFIRDILIIPLVFLVLAFPIVGFIIALVIWLGIIRYIFATTWAKAAMAWVISIILPFIIALFILIPLAIILLTL